MAGELRVAEVAAAEEEDLKIPETSPLIMLRSSPTRSPAVPWAWMVWLRLRHHVENEIGR